MKGGSQVVFLASETLIMSAEVFFPQKSFLINNLTDSELTAATTLRSMSFIKTVQFVLFDPSLNAGCWLLKHMYFSTLF